MKAKARNKTQYQLEDPPNSTSTLQSTTTEEEILQEGKNTQKELSRSQQEKFRKLRRKAQVVVEHVDIIKDDFWAKRPWILSNRPGKLPAEEG
jgi:tRNA(His) guanylyltransferase